MGRQIDVCFHRRDHSRARPQNRSGLSRHRQRHEERQAEGRKILRRKALPTITFHSTKVVQTAPNSFEVDGDFTIRGVSNPEKLTMTLPADATGFEHIDGKMVFDRKDYGMNSGIPFIKIADHVEVTIALEAKEIKGPPLVYKQ